MTKLLKRLGVLLLVFTQYTVKGSPVAQHVDYIRQKVTQQGMAFEDHEVVTDDGYILKVFRIYSPHARKQ